MQMPSIMMMLLLKCSAACTGYLPMKNSLADANSLDSLCGEGSATCRVVPGTPADQQLVVNTGLQCPLQASALVKQCIRCYSQSVDTRG